MTYAAEELAAWAHGLTLDDVPAEVVAKAKLQLLDALGVGLAALGLGQLGAVQDVARELGGRPEATALGLEQRVPAPVAALVNGALMHALDYDDTHEAGYVHSSVVVAPTVLACGEAVDGTGRDVLAAAVAGYETSARIGLAAAGSLHARGFHPTSVCGVFAAALAAAKLRGLDAERMRHALGIAGSRAAGLFEFLADGSQTKPLHPGFAAQDGIVAAALAAHGATGPASVLEGRFGLLRSHVGDFDEVALTAGLGERWETLRIAVKPYPTCHCTHTCIDGLAQLVAEEGLAPADVDEIVCRVPSDLAVGLVLEPFERKLRPETAYEAKFSLPYCLAALLVRERLGLESFTPEAIADERVLALTPLVRYVVEPLAGGGELAGAVAVRTNDGRSLERSVLAPRGGSEDPLSQVEIEAKFLDNAALALDPEVAASLLTRFQMLEELRARSLLELAAPL